MTTSALELKVGELYRGKRPRKTIQGEYDDRVILWIGEGYDNKTNKYTTMIQYDSYAIRIGRHYPTTSKEAFLKWAEQRILEAEN